MTELLTHHHITIQYSAFRYYSVAVVSHSALSLLSFCCICIIVIISVLIWSECVWCFFVSRPARSLVLHHDGHAESRSAADLSWAHQTCGGRWGSRTGGRVSLTPNTHNKLCVHAQTNSSVSLFSDTSPGTLTGKVNQLEVILRQLQYDLKKVNYPVLMENNSRVS